jgi:hypothetical protein
MLRSRRFEANQGEPVTLTGIEAQEEYLRMPHPALLVEVACQAMLLLRTKHKDCLPLKLCNDNLGSC